MMRILKIPFAGGGLGRGNGSEEAPDKIVSLLDELFLNEDGKDVKIDVDKVDVVKNNLEETNDRITKKVSALPERSIILGGDHSITYACVRGYVQNFHDSGIIIFDAHPDCENDFAPPSQEDVVCALVNEGLIDASRIIIIGLRNWDGNEIEFLNKKRIKYFSMKQIFEYSIKDIMDTVTETAKQWKNLYLSIDIDAVDPAFAPGTGYREPAGLSSRELIYCLQRIKRLPNLRMIDIVEINPPKDVVDMTSKLGAKIIKELM